MITGTKFTEVLRKTIVANKRFLKNNQLQKNNVDINGFMNKSPLLKNNLMSQAKIKKKISLNAHIKTLSP